MNNIYYKINHPYGTYYCMSDLDNSNIIDDDGDTFVIYETITACFFDSECLVEDSEPLDDMFLSYLKDPNNHFIEYITEDEFHEAMQVCKHWQDAKNSVNREYTGIRKKFFTSKK